MPRNIHKLCGIRMGRKCTKQHETHQQIFCYSTCSWLILVLPLKKTDSQHFSQLQLTAAVCGVFYDRGLAQYRVQLLEVGVSFFSLHHWPFTFSVSLTSAHSLFRSRQDARGVNDTDALQNLVGQLRTLESNNTLSFI